LAPCGQRTRIYGLPTSTNGVEWLLRATRSDQRQLKGRYLDRSGSATDDPRVPKESDRPGKRITIRVSLELYDAIDKLAKRDRRTIAGWLKIVAEDAVASAGAVSKKR